MTREEKISMYQKKKAFVEDLSRVFECRSYSTGVELLEYELWENEEQGYFQEYAIITFVGGGQSHISVNGNSTCAIFQAIADNILGGYYKEEFIYRELPKSGLKKLEL